MATLLHIDSSLYGETSVSRALTATFRREWEAQDPTGTVIYRDLSANPLPHIDLVAHSSAMPSEAGHTPEQIAALALRSELADEIERADVILIGSPMHNFTIPSALKAWIDQVILAGRTMGPTPSAAGTRTVVMSARGGGYGPGAPRESCEFVVRYLDKVLSEMLALDVEFVVAEFTLARNVPALAGMIDRADASLAQAHEDAAQRAKALVTQFVG